MNSLSHPIEQALQRARLPYDITGGLKFFDRREVKDILAYLRVIDNPKDSISLERIINTPKRGIGDSTVSRLYGDGSVPLWDAVAAEGGRNPDSKIGRFFTMMLELMEAAQELRVSQLCHKVIDDTDYLKYLKDDDPESAEDRANNVEATVSDIRYQEEDNISLKLHDYLRQPALHALLTILTKPSKKCI